MSKETFITSITEGYTFKGESIDLGVAKYDDVAMTGTFVKAPLRTFNRHGLIAGATGTGKTKTLQMLAENLAGKGVSVLMMDIKGDLSGVAMPGTANPKVEERQKLIGLPIQFKGNTTEFLTISKQAGTKMRATVSEFGPVLFSKILDLNDTQESVVAMIFKYCDDSAYPLLDLKDFKAILNFITNEGKEAISKEYGAISTSSVGTILRKVIELEQQGAEMFFGERSFEVQDLVRIDEQGNGILSIMRLVDIQDKPKLFSTFMLCLLAEIYASFPERGDVDKPELVIFIDEAHLIFNEASKALLNQIETIIKLIRSKGIGIFFITQNPTDIPESVLGQCGMKIQHALRAFTANDQKAIRMAAANFPVTEHFDIEKTLISMGIGEALVTVLSERGTPTPLAVTMMRAPMSRMDVLTDDELKDIVSNSKIARKYNEVIDRESAYEMLKKKVEEAKEEVVDVKAKAKEEEKQEGGILDTVGNMVNSSVGKVVMREVTRGLLGVLGLGGTTRRKKSLF
ncbi:MAG: DUF853 family protein [Chitinophagales bacterium]|nr:DUF853 family protein [Chitinophagales bacterium]